MDHCIRPVLRHYVAASEAQQRLVYAEQSLRRAAAEQIGQASPTVNPMPLGKGFESGRSLRWHELDWRCGIETEYKYDLAALATSEAILLNFLKIMSTHKLVGG